jgi:hypothetical protein
MWSFFSKPLAESDPFALVEFLRVRNILMKPFTVLISDASKVRWKGTQVRMKEEYFQWHFFLNSHSGGWSPNWVH